MAAGDRVSPDAHRQDEDHDRRQDGGEKQLSHMNHLLCGPDQHRVRLRAEVQSAQATATPARSAPTVAFPWPTPSQSTSSHPQPRPGSPGRHRPIRPAIPVLAGRSPQAAPPATMRSCPPGTPRWPAQGSIRPGQRPTRRPAVGDPDRSPLSLARSQFLLQADPHSSRLCRKYCFSMLIDRGFT